MTDQYSFVHKIVKMLYVLDKNVVIVLSINLATYLSGLFSMTNVCPESQWNSVLPVES